MRYAAVGDSFTEGVGDPAPDGSLRGWADRVAAGLAAGSGQPVSYANFAVRGRLLAPIVTDQLEAALALAPTPTLVTLNGGGNDMLRPGMDAARLIELTEQAVRRCVDADVRLVLLSGADPSDHLPFGRQLRRRGEDLTAAIWAIADRYQTTVVDVFHDQEIRHRAYWSDDRLHLNSAGHRRVAGLVLQSLGQQAPPAANGPAVPPRGGVRAELRYLAEHVVPWVARHARGRSSGDGRTGKHLAWTPVPPR